MVPFRPLRRQGTCSLQRPHYVNNRAGQPDGAKLSSVWKCHLFYEDLPSRFWTVSNTPISMHASMGCNTNAASLEPALHTRPAAPDTPKPLLSTFSPIVPAIPASNTPVRSATSHVFDDEQPSPAGGSHFSVATYTKYDHNPITDTFATSSSSRITHCGQHGVSVLIILPSPSSEPFSVSQCMFTSVHVAWNCGGISAGLGFCIVGVSFCPFFTSIRLQIDFVVSIHS